MTDSIGEEALAPVSNIRPKSPVQIKYAAVIRAYQCTPMLNRLLNDLRLQTAPPQEIIIVDASSDKKEFLSISAEDIIIVEYPADEFNYSKALNVGTKAHHQPYTMNISSHIELYSKDIVEEAIRAAFSVGAEVVSVVRHVRHDGTHSHHGTLIYKENHDGYNGISNSMSIIPSFLLKERPFREDVFAAEDQEWTRYYLERFDRPILMYCSTSFGYKNSHDHNQVAMDRKARNDDVAIGYFVNRRLLRPLSIAKRVARAALAIVRRNPRAAKAHLGTAWALAKANFIKPQRDSRYF